MCLHGHVTTVLRVCFSVKDVTNKEVLGILVSYRVKVKLVVSRGGYSNTHTHTLLTSLPVLSSSLFPVAVISEVWRCFYLPDVTQ